MTVSIKELKDSHIEVTIEVSKELWDKAWRTEVAKLSKQANIPGFRKGHVPEKVLVQKLGEDYVNAHVQMEAVNEAYRHAVETEKLEVIEQPHDLNIISQDPLKFSLVVSVMPQLKLDDEFKKFKIEKKEVTVEEKDVQAVLNETTARFTTHTEESAEAAAMGDKVEVDFQGKDKDGKDLDGTDGKNYGLILGSQSFIPGFEEELVGLKAGEEKEFTITFPKDYHHEPFKSKEVVFAVKVNKVLKAKAPELTPAFIKDLTGKEMDLEAFKADIRERVITERTAAERSRREEEFLQKAAEKYVTEHLPHALHDRELEFMLDEFKRNLANQGVKIEDFFAQTGRSEEDLFKEWHGEAEKRARQRLALEQLMKHAKMEVTADDIEAEIEKIASSYNMDGHKEQVKKIYEKESARASLSGRIELTKFFDMVLGDK